MEERYVGLRADLLWSPIIQPLQLFLPPSLMPSIKYWYLEVCAWHSPHISKLGTDVVVPFLQVLHRTLLRIRQVNTPGHKRGMVWSLPARHTGKCTPAHLELLVVIPVMDNYKTQVKAAAEVKEVVSLCLSPSIIVEIQLVLLL